MPDLATLGPVILAYLRPFPGHRDDVKREFAALAESVWKNEDKTRCYYWLYPEDNPDEMRVIEIYNGPEGMDIHATGNLTFDTFQRSHPYGIRVDMEGLKRRKEGLPEIPPQPDVEIRGLDIDYLQPVESVPSFLGPPDLDRNQVVIISIITSKPGKRPEVAAALAKLAAYAKEAGAQTFWVNEDPKGSDKLWSIVRFADMRREDAFGNNATVSQVQAELSDLSDKVESERCHWAEQGFFQKLYQD
ncbi:hypothetical protein DER44DRAFT_766051 [Fusarium oxysporum]|nr:hypothetical protein DER44DRAFT_766051 [Fusarium oxysporum]